MDDSEVDKDFGESSEKNGEASDNLEYNPKFLH